MLNLELSAPSQLTRRQMRRMKFRRNVVVAVVFLLAISAMFALNMLRIRGFIAFLGVYGTLNVCYLLIKTGLSAKYQPYTGAPPDYKVSVVIPGYNEAADAVVGTVRSILAQDYPIHEIYYVDDGSKDPSAYEALKEMSKTEPRLIVHRLDQNKGKRHAQAWAFERASGDVFVTVDSDCYLFPDTIRELLKPLNDKSVMAATGHVTARNRTDSILTRLIDMRYENAFRVERASQSVTGNVLVCSGPLSAYRREVITENLERYKNQTFLGKPVQFGDDRCLTNYAIEKGKTVYQSTSRCLTDVPTTIRKFLKQQVRWNKSFFRESIQALKLSIRKRKWNVLLWVTFELLTWIAFGTMLITGLIIKPFVSGAIVSLYYLGYIAVSAYARNVYYVLSHPLSFLLAPLYGLIHIFLLLPLRLYSLFTINVTKWGTR
jgi:hyaluronan synthase